MPRRVKKYEGTVYYSSTGSSQTKLYEFTQEHADTVGGVLEEDGLNIVLAEKLCEKWNRRGQHVDIRYTYRIPFDV